MVKKQYIITDPCYILDDVTWGNICDQCKSEDFYNGTFDSLVTKELNKLASTTDAQATHTGFGDWENLIHSDDESKVLHGDFFADSGMVCVVEYNDAIRKALINNDNEKLIERGGVAVIETEGNVTIEFDHTDKSWTEITIQDDNNVFCSIPASSTYDEDESDEWEDDEELNFDDD